MAPESAARGAEEMSRQDGPSFGAVLRSYWRAAGLTQEALAERAGVSGRTIADLERGVNRTPRQDTLRLLATALRLAPPTRDIFEGAASAARSPRPLTTSPGGPATVGIHRPPVVGRQRDLALVEQHVAGSGPPVVLFSGEPGIGKTRLLQEACRRAARDGWMVVQGGCHRRGGQEPYAPLQDALERHVRERSPSQLRDDLRGCAWLVRLLPELARGPIEPVPAWTLPPEQERRLMWLAVARFLATIAGPAGTLLVLDDLQWAGADALDLLATLARGATDTRLRIVGAYRDTEVTPLAPLATVLADLAHTGLVTHRRLAPLAPADALQVIAGVLPGDQDAGQIREQIVQRAGGVPFFLVSFAEAQRATTGENPGEAVPWHIEHSIRQRMHALAAWAREVVEIAAVAGRECSPTLLAATAARPLRAVGSALQAACHARLLEDAGTTAYRFAHDVIREVVEADLGPARRMILHRDIARALEEASGEPPLESLAYHYTQGQDHAQAALWLERAGDRAAGAFATATALTHYTAARQHLQAGAAGAEPVARLAEKVGDAHMSAGAYRQAQENFAHARALTVEVARRSEVGRKEGLTWHRRGEFDRALAMFDALECEASTAGTALPPGVRAALDLSRGEVYLGAGAGVEAAAAVKRAVTALTAVWEDRTTERPLAQAELLRAKIAYNRRKPAQMDAHARRTLARMAALGDQQGLAQGWELLSQAAWLLDDWSGQEEYAQEAMRIHERIGNQEGISTVWEFLAFATYLRGDLPRAAECARRILAIAEHSGSRPRARFAWACLGLVAGELGDLDRAEECLRHGMTGGTHGGDHLGQEAGFLWNAAGVTARARGDLHRAEACFQRTLAFVREGGHWGFGATARLGLAWVAVERGDLGGAARWARAARRLARAGGAHDIAMLAPLTLACVRLRGRTAGTSWRRLLAVVEAACALATRRGFPRAGIDAALLRAEAHIAHGAPAEARSAAEDALRRARDQQRRREEARALYLLGLCALTEGQAAAGEAHMRAALALQKEAGGWLDDAHTCVALARLLGDESTEGHALLTAAWEQFTVSGVTLESRGGAMKESGSRRVAGRPKAERGG